MSRRAIVTSPDPGSLVNGFELHSRQLAHLLRRLGFDVVVAGPPGRGPGWLDRQGGSALWQARAVRRLAGRADLTVTTSFIGWPGRWGGRRIHVYAGNLVRLARYQTGRRHWRVRWALAGGLAEAMGAWGATVVALSEQAAEDARRLYRVRVDAVLPSGVDTDVFRPRDRVEARRRLGLAEDTRYGLFVGRPEPGKGPGIALEACRRAGFQLLSAGPRAVPGSIALGLLRPDDLAWAYAAVDAVVMPTHYEGFGAVVVEALACGVPVVTTPTGWARDLGRRRPECRPLLVDPDPSAVAAALGRIESPSTRAAAAAARAEVLEQNTLAAFDRRWTEFLDGMGVLA